MHGRKVVVRRKWMRCRKDCRVAGNRLVGVVLRVEVRYCEEREGVVRG